MGCCIQKRGYLFRVGSFLYCLVELGGVCPRRVKLGETRAPWWFLFILFLSFCLSFSLCLACCLRYLVSHRRRRGKPPGSHPWGRLRKTGEGEKGQQLDEFKVVTAETGRKSMPKARIVAFFFLVVDMFTFCCFWFCFDMVCAGRHALCIATGNLSPPFM